MVAGKKACKGFGLLFLYVMMVVKQMPISLSYMSTYTHAYISSEYIN